MLQRSNNTDYFYTRTFDDMVVKLTAHVHHDWATIKLPEKRPFIFSKGVAFRVFNDASVYTNEEYLAYLKDISQPT